MVEVTDFLSNRMAAIFRPDLRPFGTIASPISRNSAGLTLSPIRVPVNRWVGYQGL